MLALGLVLRIDWENRHAHLVVALPAAPAPDAPAVESNSIVTDENSAEHYTTERK
jgi:hypothetical protein